MPGFTNDYIEKLMYKITKKPMDFIGVFPCDIFLTKVNEDKLMLKAGNCFIINQTTVDLISFHSLLCQAKWLNILIRSEYHPLTLT